MLALIPGYIVGGLCLLGLGLSLLGLLMAKNDPAAGVWIGPGPVPEDYLRPAPANVRLEGVNRRVGDRQHPAAA